MKPCLDCGTPTDDTRCPEHTTYRDHTLSRVERGYDAAWSRLSKRARRLQPFCTDCGTTDDLTADHSAQAWERRAAGKTIRLRDIAVVCRSCNGRRGAAKPRGGSPGRRGNSPLGEAKTPLHLRTVLNRGGSS